MGDFFDSVSARSFKVGPNPFMAPAYDLNKIKFKTDGPTFERAVGLYEGGKVTRFEETVNGFSAVVLGTEPYRVFVSARHYDLGTCTCYLGQKGTLCKHLVAVAIHAVTHGKPLADRDKRLASRPICSGRLGSLNKAELAAIKKSVTSAMRYIKPYEGPSRIWFAYQNSLREGCNRLSSLLCDLPVSKQTARLWVDLLLRLDRKLCEGGVDDSDGTVGGFIAEGVRVLVEYAALDPACVQEFKTLQNRNTCFGWEMELLALIE